ncbi:hypothetical protein [Thalassovita aquimarina]|uniref:Uncharacterized protein n=1 Tax=Thalassovita aquimarina TaxID=2785917 RepID=A0ABS5HSH3_9RHOB|nr:hypothetical protein [Thalassovita aquimarina]MBR9651543.1 hypothetical protein [Thalassovita aquimarina]
MAKLTKDTLFKAGKPRAETTMDKTSRAVREILDDEAEQRETKTARLRKARLEREASTPVDAPETAVTGTRKKPRAKAD